MLGRLTSKIKLIIQMSKYSRPSTNDTFCETANLKNTKNEFLPPCGGKFFKSGNKMNLAGKSAVIIGGTKGIGLAVAKLLVESGVSRTVITGRDVQVGAKEVKLLNEMCGIDQSAVYVPADILCKGQLLDLYNYLEMNGGPDIAINSAGVLSESISWKKMVDLNVKAIIASTTLCAEQMRRLKRPGVIINISAIYAIKPMAEIPIFSATKAAVLTTTNGFSKSEIYNNVRFITACVGPTDTPMLLNLAPGDIGEWAKEEQENLLDKLKAKQNVDKVAKWLMMLINYGDNGGTYLLNNGELRKREEEMYLYRPKPFKRKEIFKINQ